MGRRGIKIISHSAEETFQLGGILGQTLPHSATLCFFGDLGAGKTTFIKGLISTQLSIPSDQINSPTFVYLNIYEGQVPFYHFDLYRLKGVEEFLSLGFEEYFQGEGICCIEWSEKIKSLLPNHIYTIHFKHINENEREIEWYLT